MSIIFFELNYVKLRLNSIYKANKYYSDVNFFINLIFILKQALTGRISTLGKN